MKKFKVDLEVTKFGTEEERLEVSYTVLCRDDGHAVPNAIDMAYNDGFSVDEYKVIDCQEI